MSVPGCSSACRPACKNILGTLTELTGTVEYNGGNTAGFHAYPGWCWADNSSSTRIQLRQRMRRQPDVSIVGTISGGTGMGAGKYGVYGGGSNAWQTPGTWTPNDINDHSFRISASSYSTFGTGKAVGFYMYGGAGFKIDAEI